LVREYVNQNEDSILEKVLNERFGRNAVTMIKKIIETNAFNDQGSIFFSELGLNNLLTKKIRAEFIRNVGSVSDNLNQCVSLLQRLG
jgi:hypothetical protein